jgi:signal transduction histidine kinase
MRSLFLKIFVWFWLAMALVLLAHALSTMLVFDETPRRRLEGEIAMFGLVVAEKYEREGKGGANNYLRLLEGPMRSRNYLFDESGNELLGTDVPPKAREIAASIVAGREGNFMQTARTDLAARRVSAPGGGQFIVVRETPRPTGIRLPFWPGVWWAQLIAVLLTTGAVCYLLARYFTSPIVKLRAATRQFAGGDLSARVGAAKRRDELADLGRDFDLMAERIQSLVNSQKRLLHDISHELRSPLARLKIALELAREGDGEERGWALERIEREADRLNDLIGQLLTLARLDSNSAVADVTTINLKRLVDEVASDADFEARNYNRAVRVVASQDCSIAGNERLLRSAVENVVRNAMSYTAEGTAVEVSLRREGGGEQAEAVVSVTDRGAGVPQAALADIFRPFYRVADARDRQSGGIGLGLSISQRAVHIHGGTVTASNVPGGGLAVEIRLPLRCISYRDGE